MLGKIVVKIYHEDENYYIDIDVSWKNKASKVIDNVPGYQEEIISDFSQPHKLKES